MTERLKELKTTREIVPALGGEPTVAKMTQVGQKAVNNWVNWDRIPAAHYGRLLYELNILGFTARPSLFGQVGCDGLRLRRISK